MRIKSVYVWIPDDHGFYTVASPNPASIYVGEISEDHLTYKSSRRSVQFTIFGWNQTDKGHYINIDVFFEQTDPAKQN